MAKIINREGTQKEIEASELVVGDIVQIRGGRQDACWHSNNNAGMMGSIASLVASLDSGKIVWVVGGGMK